MKTPACVLTGIALAAVLAGCGSTVQQTGASQALSGLSGGPTTSSQGPSQGAPSLGGDSGSTATLGSSNSTRAVVNTAAVDLPPISGPVDHRPIKIGFLSIDYGKAYTAVGLNQGPPFDWKANYRALVDGLNARGGLHGRRIVPVFYSIDGTAASYSTASQAACTYLVQDQHVEAVLSYAASAQSIMLSPCFVQAGVAQIDANFGIREDTGDLRRNSGLIAPEALPVDKYAAALITRANAQGWLTTKDRLGVFVEGCPDDVRTYDKVVTPLMARLGIGVEEYTTKCIVGFSDVSQTVSDIQAASLRFRADGVDRITYLTLGESGINGLFTQNADSQHWYPVYLVTSITQPVNGAQIGQIAADQLPNIRGLGWLPGWDVDQPTWSPAQRSLQAQCKELAHVGGVNLPEPRGPQANLNPYMECDTLLLLDRVLGITHGATSFSAVMGAIGALGSSYLSPMTQGTTSFTTGKHSGIRTAALFSYKTSCKCFTYDTSPVAVP